MENNQPIRVSRLRTGRERVYFILTLMAAFFLWSWFVYAIVHPMPGLSAAESKQASQEAIKFWRELLSPVNIISFIGFSLFSHLLSMAFIRMNGVKVGPKQFPEIYEAVQKIGKQLGMKTIPDTFIINGNGVVNAFAARLVFRKIMVLYSDLVDALIEDKDQRQLEAVIAHELGHHVLGHTGLKEWLFLPLGFVPFLGTALTRARERSADQIMLAVTGDPEVCKRAFVKLAIGKRKLGKQVNIEAFLEQEFEETGFFSWLAEKLSDHPHLPRRIAAMDKI